MYKPIQCFLLLLFFSLQAQQSEDLSVNSIPDELKEHANSVVRDQKIRIEIHSQKSYSIQKREVVTVLNAKGKNNLDVYEHYSPDVKVSSLTAWIYDANGKEIKKYKYADFKDQSVADGFSVLTDDRVLYLDYTPTLYPFTVVFESEVKSNNTAFLPSWSPINDFYESVQKARIEYDYPTDLELSYKSYNSEGYELIKNQSNTNLSLEIHNLKAIKSEAYAPSKAKILPTTRFALNRFNLIGVSGVAKTWSEHGIWMYNTLLKDTEELPEATVSKIRDLVKDASTDVEKAKRIYAYMQSRTRYVSIQLGVGGWKPMLAKDVDKLGYGDCKALSNYMRSLLKAVGITSYYTVVYAGDEIRDITSDFVAMQGNHVILALPQKEGYLFLECTNQEAPFGYQGDFTDDRDVLIIKPDGGELYRTPHYREQRSKQTIVGNVTIQDNGTLITNFTRKSHGVFYDNHQFWKAKSKPEVIDAYKESFSWINNLSVTSFKFQDDKESASFTEEISLTAPDYIQNNGGYLNLMINVLNQSSNVPQRYRNRIYPIEIQRGYFEEDEYTLQLSSKMKIDGLPDPVVLTSQFGEYTLQITEVKSDTYKVKRTFLLKKGMYEKNEYENFRKFREQIARYDATKVVIIKTP